MADVFNRLRGIACGRSGSVFADFERPSRFGVNFTVHCLATFGSKQELSGKGGLRPGIKNGFGGRLVPVFDLDDDGRER